jgi:hypothetical protein
MDMDADAWVLRGGSPAPALGTQCAPHEEPVAVLPLLDGFFF